MAGGLVPHPEPLGRTVVVWLIPVLIAALGIGCFVGCIISEEQTIISDGSVIFSFLAFTTVGVLICYKYRNFFVKVYHLNPKKIRRRDFIILSAITFGTIPFSLFLLLNKTFVSKKEYKDTVKIIEKQLVRRRFGGRSGFYDNRVATSYGFGGQEFSRDFLPSPATDTAKFIEITYKHGLFGYDVVTDLELK